MLNCLSPPPLAALQHGECTLVFEAIELSQTIQRYPPERLTPFLDQLQIVADSFQSIAKAIESKKPCCPEGNCAWSDGSGSTSGTAVEEVFELEGSSAISAPAPLEESTQRDAKAARQCLSAAIELIPVVEKAAWNICFPSPSRRGRRPRALHVEHAPRSFVSDPTDDNILAVCSLMALARDLHDFEKAAGFISTDLQLLQQMARGEHVDVEQIDRSVRRYITTHHRALLQDTEELETAFALGIKLRLMDAIGEGLGLGSSLSVIFAFNLLDFSRLRFDCLSIMVHTLVDNPDIYNTVLEFAEFTESWWPKCQQVYDHSFGERK